MQGIEYDVVIIGGGVIGAAAARELSRYQLKTCLLEREEDVCSGTSKANSAIVHAGFDAVPGSQKARMNVAGNAMMEQLSKDLDFEFKRNGSLVLCFSLNDLPALEALRKKGEDNGVPGLEVLSGEQVRAMEPNITDQVTAALFAPSGGIVCPFGLTIGLAENACDNGVEFRFNTEVKGIKKIDSRYEMETSGGPVSGKYVVNAAGVYADRFHNMVSSEKIRIIPRKGDYCLLDKEAGGHVSSTIFQLPGQYGKGVLVSPTIHGNLLIGPTAVDVEDKEHTATTAEELKEVTFKSGLGVKHIPYRLAITSFSGLRAHELQDDFVIGEISDAPGFYDLAGMESPGLSSAPAVGKYIADLISKASGAAEKADFQKTRTGIPRIANLPMEERAKKIKENPAYGVIVCRCEEISEGEIVDAIHRTLGACSLDGVKRRVRAGMGRCQAGFCTPRTMEIMAREWGMKMEDICKNTDGSQMLIGD